MFISKNEHFQKIVSKFFKCGYAADFKFIIKNALPLMLSNWSLVIHPMISLFYCGHLGADELDAVSLGLNVINIVGLTSVYGLLSACDTTFPQIYGSSNKKLLGLHLQKAFVVQMLSCLPLIGLIINSHIVIKLVMNDENIIKLTDQFIYYYLPSIVILSIFMLLVKFTTAQNINNPVMIISFIGLGLSAALHALFIKLFKMGVEGAALASNLAYLTTIVLLCAYIYKKNILKNVWTGWTLKCLEEWSTYLKLAIPGFFGILIEWSNYEIGTFVAGSLGKVELAAMSTSLQIIYICYTVPYSIALAGNMRIGQLLGSHSPEQAKNAANVLMSMTFCSSLLVSLCLLALSSVLPYAFSDDNQIIERCRTLFKLSALVHIFDSFQVTYGGILRSVGSQLFTTISMFLCFYIIGSPIGMSLLLKTSLKGLGFFLGVIFGTIVLSIIELIFIFKIDWNEKARFASELTKTSIDKMPGVNENNTNDKNVYSISNPVFDNFLDDFKPDISIASDNDKSIHEDSVSLDESKPIQNPRSLIMKRFGVFLILFLILIVFIIIRVV